MTDNYIPVYVSGSFSDSIFYESNGEVGLGTTSPAATFHVSGSASIGGTSDPGANNLRVEGAALFGELATSSSDAWAPISIWSNITDIDAGHAAGIYIRVDEHPSDGAGGPPGDDTCALYTYVKTYVNGGDTRTKIWGLKSTVHSGENADGAMAGLELDLQNETGNPSTNRYDGTGKNGVVSMLGPGGYGGNAAFWAALDYDGAVSQTWQHAFVGSGASQATFYSAQTSNGSGGPVNPSVDFLSDTNAAAFLKSTGTHTALFDSPGLYIIGAGNILVTSVTDGLINLNYASSGSTNITHAGFIRNGTVVVGNIWSDSSTVHYAQASDRRLKENIRPYADGLATVLALRPSEFEFIGESGVTRQGLIADELHQVFPQAVFGTPDGVDADGRIRAQSVDYISLLPALVSAVQALAARRRGTRR